MPARVLRAVALGLGAVIIGGGLWLCRVGAKPGAGLRLLIPGLVLIAALVIERRRYRCIAGERPGPGWVATGERFIDPESGKLVTVFYRPSTGERRYVGS
jgi:hypothetical protein